MIALVLAACGGGQRHPSVVEDTRILGVVAEPPEAMPGEDVAITVQVADPKRRGVELLVWTCALYQGSCAESQLPFADWVAVTGVKQEVIPERLGSGLDSLEEHYVGQGSVVRQVPAEADTILEELDPIPVALYALACAPNVCPLIDEVNKALVSGEADSALMADLADPTRWMKDLPWDGVSLAAQQLLISSQEEEERNQNPIFDPRFPQGGESVIRVEAGGELELAFFVDDVGEKVYGYGYTTLGAFETRRVKEEDNGIRNWLLAPDAPGEGRVFMIFEDRDGGAALWTRGLEVY